MLKQKKREKYLKMEIQSQKETWIDLQMQMEIQKKMETLMLKQTHQETLMLMETLTLMEILKKMERLMKREKQKLKNLRLILTTHPPRLLLTGGQLIFVQTTCLSLMHRSKVLLQSDKYLSNHRKLYLLQFLSDYMYLLLTSLELLIFQHFHLQ